MNDSDQSVGCMSGPESAVYSWFLGRAVRDAEAARTSKYDRARKRREREASAATEERNSANWTDGGTQRGTQVCNRRMSGPEPWVATR